MKFTKKTFVNAAIGQGLDAGTAETLWYAASKGYEISYFPEQFLDLLETFQTVEVLSVRTEFINQWMKEWPSLGNMQEDVRENKYAISGNRPEVVKRMRQFMSELPARLPHLPQNDQEYVEDLIMRATRWYLKERREDGWYMVKKNHKFIKDTNGSVLADWMERVLNRRAPASDGRRRFTI